MTIIADRMTAVAKITAILDEFSEADDIEAVIGAVVAITADLEVEDDDGDDDGGGTPKEVEDDEPIPLSVVNG